MLGSPVHAQFGFRVMNFLVLTPEWELPLFTKLFVALQCWVLIARALGHAVGLFRAVPEPILYLEWEITFRLFLLSIMPGKILLPRDSLSAAFVVIRSPARNRSSGVKISHRTVVRLISSTQWLLPRYSLICCCFAHDAVSTLNID